MSDGENEAATAEAPQRSRPQEHDRDDRRRQSDDGAGQRDDDKRDDGDDDGGEKGGDGKGKKKRSRWPLIIFGIIVLVGAIGGFIWWWMGRGLVSTDDAYTDGNIVMVAPQVAGYVTELAVTDNQFVHKGDLLVQIDPRTYQAARDQAKGQLEAAQAQLADARLALEKAKTTYPAQLAQAEGQLAQVQGVLYNAQADYKRQHAVTRGATTQQNIDQSTANLRSAEGQVKQAQAQVDVAKLIPQNIAQSEAQVKQLEGQVQQAQANLDKAELNLQYAHMTAPQDGWVTKRNVNQGDYLQPGQQIMAIVTPTVWVTANFKETQLDQVRPGQKTDISVDAYPSLHLEGHVDSIQRGSGSKFSAFPAENATGNFVKIVQRVPVKIVIDSGMGDRQVLPLGISVVPTVHVQ